MKQFLLKLLKSDINAIVQEQLRIERKRVQDREDEIASITAEFRVGSPVIVFGNEWDDLAVGFVVGVEYITKAQCPAFVIKNYITGETAVTFGTVVDYSHQRFHALMKLSPYERWAVRTNYGNNEHTSYSYGEFMNAGKKLLSLAQMMNVLSTSGFFADFNEYLKKDL